METIKVFFRYQSELKVTTLHYQVVEVHRSLCFISVREQNHGLPCFPFPWKSQFYTSSHKIESSKNFLNIPISQGKRKSSDLDGCFLEQAVNFNLFPTPRSWWIAGSVVSVPSGGLSHMSSLLPLSFFIELIAGVLLLRDGNNFDVPFPNEHSIFSEEHRRKLCWYFNNCPPRKLPMLKD